MAIKVLKLNRSYLPIEVINVRKAISLVERGRAEIIEHYDDKHIRTFKKSFRTPCIIRLLYFVAPKKEIKFYLPFTRHNVYNIYNGICAYCGKEVSRNVFEIEHIHPQSKGGPTCWENCVLSCHHCNSKKGNMTLKEAGMKLLVKPYTPIVAESYAKCMILRVKEAMKYYTHKSWNSYCYWNCSLDQPN